MKRRDEAPIWWGAPKKFTTENTDRKVSWLELFYDLVYVIAISRITHHLTGHFDLSTLVEYLYFFPLIFWGWLNGSLYHDLHGAEGLRTRLMTLWQMMIVAALVITLDSDPSKRVFNITIVLLIMQLYITYQWWSVGIYDKAHRRLNRPWTVIYMLSFILMVSTFFVQESWMRILFFSALLLNYLPPFLLHWLRKSDARSLSLSSSMSERLGLFTIIIFGEVIVGVVNGMSVLQDLSFPLWTNFALSVSIVFALWWIFFTLVSDRDCKKGILYSSILEILYIPTLMALAIIGISFDQFFEAAMNDTHHLEQLIRIFGICLGIFLAGITAMSFLLHYPTYSEKFRWQTRQILTVGLLSLIFITNSGQHLKLMTYLAIVLVVLLLMIAVLNYQWYSLQAKRSEREQSAESS